MQTIRNITKNTKISPDFRIIGGILPKFVGLMFSIRQNKALIFKFSDEKIISLHMLFVFYPIDVLFLDKNKIVVDKKENFKPFAFYKSGKKAMYAIELPDGIVRKTKTETGDKVSF